MTAPLPGLKVPQLSEVAPTPTGDLALPPPRVSWSTATPRITVDAAVATQTAGPPPLTPAPESITPIVAEVLSVFTGGATSFAGGDQPQTPADPPLSWTLLAFARRELQPGSSPQAAGAGATSTAEQIDQPSLPGDAMVVAPSNPADLQTLYTGEPTFFTQIVTAGLQIVGAVLRPFGGLVAFTSLKVPFLSDGIPPFFLTGGLDVARTEFEGMPVWTLQNPDPSGKYVVALHGGAYAAEASIFHWITYTNLARATGATVVVPDYPLVGEEGGTADNVVPASADFISQVIQEHGAGNVSVLGDSAGGGLAVAAVHELVSRGAPVPDRMVLLAPWLDVTMSDPLSATINDPLLTIPALRSDGEQWAGSLDPTDPWVSPLFGALDGLPPTTVFSGSLDMLAADTLRLRDRTIDEGYSNFTFVLRKGLVHDWPIFGFFPEANAIQPEIYGALLGSDSVTARI